MKPEPPSRRSSTGSCGSSMSHIAASARGLSKIRLGLRKANPAAIILWAFHELGGGHGGVTSRRVIAFLKRHYVVAGDPRRTGSSIGAVLRSAAEFGLLRRHGNLFFLASATPPHIET